MPLDFNVVCMFTQDNRYRPHSVYRPQSFEASIRTPPACQDECADCHASTFTAQVQRSPQYSYRHRLSADEATAATRPLLDEISDHRAHLSSMLLNHADVLLARWNKKGRLGTQQKRQDLLKTAAPDLPESSVFLLSWGYGLCVERMAIMSRCPRAQHKLLLPWLTVDLLKTHPDALFALLHHRTVHGPEEWAAFDCLQLEKHFLNGDFDTDWSSKAMVMHGKHTYGTLVDWNTPGIHRADLIGFPLGLLILKAQAYLMRLLRNIADAILVDVLEDAPSSGPGRTNKWQQRTTLQNDFKPVGSVESWSSYTHGFLCAAPNLDSLDILTLTRSRRERTEDHLRALQCNIPYMRRQIQALFGAPIWRGVPATEKGAFLGVQLHFATSDYLLWRCLETEIEHFCAIRQKYGDLVAHGKPLPRNYDRALGDLTLLLINQILSRSQNLMREIAFTPGLSMHWTRSQPTPGGPFKMFPLTYNNTMDTFKKDRLYWILTQLCNHPESRDAFDFPMLFTMLHEHLAASPRKERERLDELMHQHINDLAACHELLNAVGRLHRPQSTNPGLQESLKTKRFAWRIAAGAAEEGKYSTQLESLFSRIGGSLMEAFEQHKPPQGPRGKAWVEYTRQLHSALDKFWGWGSMRFATKLELAGTTLTPDEEEELFGITSFGAADEHVEAVRAEETAILEEIEKRQKLLAIPVPVFMDSQGASCNTGVASTVSKRKTRPEQQAHVTDATSAKVDQTGLDNLSNLSLADDIPSLDPIPVSRRNFDEVFGAMYPSDRAEAKRSVDWNTFSRAMKAVGCALDNGGGGSEVLFKHDKFGKITFHKPHPEPRVDPIMLHAWGDRLARRFQWSRERFVVAGAES